MGYSNTKDFGICTYGRLGHIAYCMRCKAVQHRVFIECVFITVTTVYMRPRLSLKIEFSIKYNYNYNLGCETECLFLTNIQNQWESMTVWKHNKPYVAWLFPLRFLFLTLWPRNTRKSVSMEIEWLDLSPCSGCRYVQMVTLMVYSTMSQPW